MPPHSPQLSPNPSIPLTPIYGAVVLTPSGNKIWSGWAQKPPHPIRLGELCSSLSSLCEICSDHGVVSFTVETASVAAIVGLHVISAVIAHCDLPRPLLHFKARELDHLFGILLGPQPEDILRDHRKQTLLGLLLSKPDATLSKFSAQLSDKALTTHLTSRLQVLDPTQQFIATLTADSSYVCSYILDPLQPSATLLEHHKASTLSGVDPLGVLNSLGSCPSPLWSLVLEHASSQVVDLNRQRKGPEKIPSNPDPNTPLPSSGTFSSTPESSSHVGQGVSSSEPNSTTGPPCTAGLRLKGSSCTLLLGIRAFPVYAHELALVVVKLEEHAPGPPSAAVHVEVLPSDSSALLPLLKCMADATAVLTRTIFPANKAVMLQSITQPPSAPLVPTLYGSKVDAVAKGTIGSTAAESTASGTQVGAALLGDEGGDIGAASSCVQENEGASTSTGASVKALITDEEEAPNVVKLLTLTAAAVAAAAPAVTTAAVTGAAAAALSSSPATPAAATGVTASSTSVAAAVAAASVQSLPAVTPAAAVATLTAASTSVVAAKKSSPAVTSAAAPGGPSHDLEVNILSGKTALLNSHPKIPTSNSPPIYIKDHHETAEGDLPLKALGLQEGGCHQIGEQPVGESSRFSSVTFHPPSALDSGTGKGSASASSSLEIFGSWVTPSVKAKARNAGLDPKSLPSQSAEGGANLASGGVVATSITSILTKIRSATAIGPKKEVKSPADASFVPVVRVQETLDLSTAMTPAIESHKEHFVVQTSTVAAPPAPLPTPNQQVHTQSSQGTPETNGSTSASLEPNPLRHIEGPTPTPPHPVPSAPLPALGRHVYTQTSLGTPETDGSTFASSVPNPRRHTVGPTPATPHQLIPRPPVGSRLSLSPNLFNRRYSLAPPGSRPPESAGYRARWYRYTRQGDVGLRNKNLRQDKFSTLDRVRVGIYVKEVTESMEMDKQGVFLLEQFASADVLSDASHDGSILEKYVNPLAGRPRMPEHVPKGISLPSRKRNERLVRWSSSTIPPQTSNIVSLETNANLFKTWRSAGTSDPASRHPSPTGVTFMSPERVTQYASSGHVPNRVHSREPHDVDDIMLPTPPKTRPTNSRHVSVQERSRHAQRTERPSTALARSGGNGGANTPDSAPVLSAPQDQLQPPFLYSTDPRLLYAQASGWLWPAGGVFYPGQTFPFFTQQAPPYPHYPYQLGYLPGPNTPQASFWPWLGQNPMLGPHHFAANGMEGAPRNKTPFNAWQHLQPSNQGTEVEQRRQGGVSSKPPNIQTMPYVWGTSGGGYGSRDWNREGEGRTRSAERDLGHGNHTNGQLRTSGGVTNKGPPSDAWVETGSKGAGAWPFRGSSSPPARQGYETAAVQNVPSGQDWHLLQMQVFFQECLLESTSD